MDSPFSCAVYICAYVCARFVKVLNYVAEAEGFYKYPPRINRSLINLSTNIIKCVNYCLNIIKPDLGRRVLLCVSRCSRSGEVLGVSRGLKFVSRFDGWDCLGREGNIAMN